MNKYIEVIYNMLPLLDTMEEGIEHLGKQLSELRHEEAFGMIQDIMFGIASVENSLVPIVEEIGDKGIEKTSLELSRKLARVVSGYRDGNSIETERRVKEELKPAFKEWKTAIESSLKVFTVS